MGVCENNLINSCDTESTRKLTVGNTLPHNKLIWSMCTVKFVRLFKWTLGSVSAHYYSVVYGWLFYEQSYSTSFQIGW